MSLSVRLGNFLYHHAFALYQPMYAFFKRKQDRMEIRLLKQYIHPGDTVMDIGANIGFYAGILSRLVGDNGAVHCFEPDVTNYNHLQRVTNGLRNLHLNNKAAGPETKKIKIYTSPELNVDHRTYRPDTYAEEIEIDAVSIDDYLRNNPKADFIKMDIQGFEMEAIKGMTQVLSQNQNIKIVSEFWPYGLSAAGSSVNEYFNYLTYLGFNCYLMQNDELLLLDAARVAQLHGQGKEQYYNIFCVRGHV